MTFIIKYYYFIVTTIVNYNIIRFKQLLFCFVFFNIDAILFNYCYLIHTIYIHNDYIQLYFALIFNNIHLLNNTFR